MTEDDEDETQRREKPKMTEDTEEDETPGEEMREKRVDWRRELWGGGQ